MVEINTTLCTSLLEEDYIESNMSSDGDQSEEMEEVICAPTLRKYLNGISGRPWTCSNCGISFFSLRSVSHEDCYCSGECKWSVILYREMDERTCIPQDAKDGNSYVPNAISLRAA